VVALVAAAAVVSTLLEYREPGGNALAPPAEAPGSPTPGGAEAFGAPAQTASPGPTGQAAASPSAGPSRTAGAGPSAAPDAGEVTTVAGAIDTISEIIEAGLVANEIRPDAAVDLRNVVQHLQDSIARGTANVSASVANLKDKVDARRREGAITGGSADLLDSELARLASL
jgi:hypothetical protein